MTKGRLEAFSDGVIAIIITIMVLELKAPLSPELAALETMLPTFLSYVLSFVYVGIYWNNHHHLFHTVHRVSGGVLWANLHLLFWLSLIPLTTKWMGQSHFATWPVVVYGVNLLLSGIAWEIVRRLLINQHDRESVLVQAVGQGWQEVVSIGLYGLGVGAAFYSPAAACVVYALVAAIWMIPDPRIERQIPHHRQSTASPDSSLASLNSGDHS